MTVLCFIDTETTGLDPAIHEAYEVCWWREDHDQPTTVVLPHWTSTADPVALEIGGYHERGFTPGRRLDRWANAMRLEDDIEGVTLVGSNPAFDAAFLGRLLGRQPWHHRLVNVAEGGMWTFGWDRPKGLNDVAAECRTRGFDIPQPDHTAEGDVRATKAVYEALRAIRAAHADLEESK
jgi:DNA polymerase III epsilon subunit-like protein